MAPVTVLSDRRALAVGWLWVNGPAIGLLFGPPAILLIAFHDSQHVSPLLFGSVFAGSFVTAWLWWSLMVPKWRLWSYRRVANPLSLKHKAVGATLTWKDASFFARSEFKSKAHVAKETEFEQRARRQYGEYQPSVPNQTDAEESFRVSLLFLVFVPIPVLALIIRDRLMGKPVSPQLNTALFLVGVMVIVAPIFISFVRLAIPNWHRILMIVTVPVGFICVVLVDYPLLSELWRTALIFLVLAITIWLINKHAARR